MESNTVKIIDSFQITGRGLLTVLQHRENGLPPGTMVIDHKTGNSWVVKKRVYAGILLAEGAEIFFDCETEFEHVDHVYKTEKARREAVKKELKKREEGVYWYLLVAVNEKDKPRKGIILKIEWDKAP